MATIPEVLQRFKSWRLLELKKDQLLKRWRSSGIGTIDQPLYVKENRLKIVDKVKIIGADVSWMSSWLAKKAGLEHAIDKQYQTELSGVGGLVKTRGRIKCEFEPSTAEISRYFFQISSQKFQAHLIWTFETMTRCWKFSTVNLIWSLDSISFAIITVKLISPGKGENAWPFIECTYSLYFQFYFPW